MDSINTFDQGMSSDMSKLYQSNKQYLSATNLRPVTTNGGSNGAMVNVKGNACQISFPTLQNIYKLVINRVLSNDGKIYLTINGETTANITITESTTTADIVAYIKNLPNCYNGTYNGSRTFDVSYTNDYIYIHQQPDYFGCEVNSSYEPSISIVSVSGFASMSFVDPDNITVGTAEPYIITDNEPLIVIGSTYIGETVYIFTCGQTNTNGLGQIWEFTYDELTYGSVIKLIYNSYLNFSKEFPIPPSATVGRYETALIQRIYWSDNNNPVRSLNVKTGNTMAIPIDLMNLRPSVDMSVPTLFNITSGTATTSINTVSTYQCAYRLLKANGAITNYSSISNIVYPTLVNLDDYEGGDVNFANLAGDSGTVNKSLIWQVDGIDTDFDTIEFVIIIRSEPTPNGFTIFKYDTQVINDRTTITTTFNNDVAVHSLHEISLDEFLIENTTFTHSKTLEEKDNRLFFGNIRNALSSVINDFDTRTFRFAPSSDDVKIKNFETDTTAFTHTITDYSEIPETYDAIPVYNLGLSTSDDSLYDDDFRYQRNSTMLGGTGPNISYKFGNVLLQTDAQPSTPGGGVTPGSFLQGSTKDDNASTHIYKNGYRKAGSRTDSFSSVSPSFNNLITSQSYPTNSIKETMVAEYYAGTFKSYQHNEIYRFAILFYSKTGTTYFVKWIGDIKFPNYSDSIDVTMADKTALGTQVTDFRSMFVDSSGAYSNIPYIQFDVNISADLANEIAGYQIVRVKRESSDRTIAETGLINQVGLKVASSDLMMPVDFSYNSDLNNHTPGISDRVLTYHPFSYICDESVTNFSNSDKLIVTEKYSGSNVKSSLWPKLTAPSGIDDAELFYLSKFYNQRATYYNPDGTNFTLSDLKIIEAGFTPAGASSGYNFNTLGVAYFNSNIDSNNVAYQVSGPRYSNSTSLGSNCVVLALDSSSTIVWSSYNDSGYNVNGLNVPISNSSKLLAMHFKPSLLKNQYGGRTVIARASNEYISCGAYVPVRTNQTYSIKTFGGDIYHGIMNIQKAIKTTSQIDFPNGFSKIWYYPSQSIYNIDARAGVFVNRDLNETNGGLTGETYGYLESKSYENTLNTYIPKPFGFNETNIFNNRVYWSKPKSNGEPSDSFTTIPALNYYDVDGNYGGITAFVTLKNNIYFLQERAFGILYINPQTVIPDQNDQPLKLGVSNIVLEKHFYTSVDAGSRHQWSVSKSNSAITFIDTRSKKIYMFNGESLMSVSDLKGMKGFTNKVLHDNILITDNPIIENGILTTYDFENNEFLYTFLNTFSGGTERNTLAYSDLINAFSTYYSFTPYVYLNNHNKLYSLSSFNNSKVYMHNVGQYGIFYDIQFDSVLKINSNANPMNTKVFDNLSWITDVTSNIELDETTAIQIPNDTFNTIRCYNDTQNTDTQFLVNTPIIGNIRKLEGSWNLQVPRNKVNYDAYPSGTYSIFDPTVLTKTQFGERMRDKYMIIELSYAGSASQFIVHSIKTSYRISDR